ncbi:MAG: L-seryl-tRNA(Sec) selenium transferase [Deltaproteobacteria bacterium]|nr:L-seryl-tRNA(Sec) selenium transferase [Deltaproteobacteria bacterium]
MAELSSHYSNLEFDLDAGRRGSRYSHVEDVLKELTGAESALVVNNNAAAVFLVLETLAKGREAVVSRGELVEIGGSFRIPDVMARSGAHMVEVGTTNKTHPKDYENAVTESTALFLKVHTSNFRIIGFTQDVPLADLVKLGEKHGIPVMKDLGSGCFLDLSNYGLTKEPTVQETIRTGVDVATFSGDKLLGGPQAGLILGKKRFVDQVKKNPLNRAVRIDKLTLAALEATLMLYRDEEEARKYIPTVAMITASVEELNNRAQRLKRRIRNAIPAGVVDLAVVDGSSRVGGGALPEMDLPTRLVALTPKAGLSAAKIEDRLRRLPLPLVCRIEQDRILLDVRTILESELVDVCKALQSALAPQ